MNRFCWFFAVGMFAFGLAGCKAGRGTESQTPGTGNQVAGQGSQMPGMGNQAAGQEAAMLPTQQAGQPEEEKNPFALGEEGGNSFLPAKSVLEVEANYRWKVANFDNADRRIDLEEKASADLVMQLENSGKACEVGYILLIDGIPQRYKMGELEGYLLPVDCGEGLSEVALRFAPTVADTKKEYVANFACIYTPSFRHSEEKQGSGYGIHHKMTQSLPWKISGNFLKEEIKISTNVTYQPVSEAIKEKYITVNLDGTVNNQIEKFLHGVFYQNGTETEQICQTEAAQLVLFGGSECSYRVSVFVDNQPVPVFSGAGCVDVVMEDGQMAVVDLDLSAVSFSDYSCMYAILCPIGTAGDIMDPMLEKTDTVTLFQ